MTNRLYQIYSKAQRKCLEVSDSVRHLCWGLDDLAYEAVTRTSEAMFNAVYYPIDFLTNTHQRKKSKRD
jgi:hypothetical protein